MGMADDDFGFGVGDSGDHTPDNEGDPVSTHGYDAAFFILAIIFAIALAVGILYFRG